MSYFYLASPYSHDDASVRADRYFEVARYFAKMMSSGVIVFSPITMCHRAAIDHGLPTNFEFWDKANTEFLRKSSGIIIAMIDGWETSRGVAHERRIAERYGLPATFAYFENDSLIITRTRP